MKAPIRLALAAAVTLATVANLPAAVPIETLYSTGLDNDHNPLAEGQTDSHYLMSYPEGEGPASVAPYVTIGGGWPLGPWQDNNASSQWLSPKPLYRPTDTVPSDPFGNYIWTLTFSLSSYVPGSVQFTAFTLWVDDALISVTLNGVNLGVGSAFQAWGSDYLSNLNAHLDKLDYSGLNTLVFTVAAGDTGDEYGNPTGLRVQIAGTADAVPEPSSLVLLLVGAGLFYLMTLRQRRSHRAA